MNRSLFRLCAAFMWLLLGMPMQSAADGNNQNSFPSWAEEPTTFIGIPLEQSLNTTVTEECPKIVKMIGTLARETPDFQQIRQLPEGKLCYLQDKIAKTYKQFRVYGIKISPLSWFAEVTTSDGTLNGSVQRLEIGFSPKNYTSIKGIFTSKYGAPHKEQAGKLKTKGGAEFETEIIDWNGQNASIHIESMDERHYDSILKMLIESGSVKVMTKSYIERRKNEIEQTNESSASKL